MVFVPTNAVHITVPIDTLLDLTCEVLEVNITDNGTELDAGALRDGQRLDCERGHDCMS